MKYGEVLEYYIEYEGLTKAEVARRAGIDRSRISEYITGTAKEPTLSRAKAIADALGITLQAMVDKMDDYED